MKKNIAIVGGGIGGLSLLYQLTKMSEFSEIFFFDAPDFSTPCTLNSTAIVAPRGVSAGLSSLGDLLLEGYQFFKKHVEDESPRGVSRVVQKTGATKKLDQFLKRYPNGRVENNVYFAKEDAFMIRPQDYTKFLLERSLRDQRVKHIQDFVLDYSDHKIKTVNGLEVLCDQVVFTCGVRNKLWKVSPQSPKIAQGSYLLFKVDMGPESFSYTLDGDNLIYHHAVHELLLGSTTSEVAHELAPLQELRQIYSRLGAKSGYALPAFEMGQVLVGLREKASKREPYVFWDQNVGVMGGFYKNGFSLAGLMSQKLISARPSTVISN